MDSIWIVLGLEPTQNVSAIRRAYAQKTRSCHPEEDPQGFLELRKAYQAALAYAERGTGPDGTDTGGTDTRGTDTRGTDTGGTDTRGTDTGDSGAGKSDARESGIGESNTRESDTRESNTRETGTEETGTGESDTGETGTGETGTGKTDTGESGTGGSDAEKSGVPKSDSGDLDAGEAEDEGWTISDRPKQEDGPNPYADHESIRSFLELYTGRQRKDQKRWLDYFTSEAFLDAAWDWRFTELLLEHVTRLEGEYPVNREFLIWLCVAYQFTVHRSVYLNPDRSERTEFRFQIHTGAQFDGQESVFQIAAKGPAPKPPKGNELAVFESFTEYRRLISMAAEDVWGEREIEEYSQIIGCYAAGYITDKCQQRGDMDHERHPAGLRLMTCFFRRKGLPEELYRITWQKLNLETAVMGRAKIL